MKNDQWAFVGWVPVCIPAERWSAVVGAVVVQLLTPAQRLSLWKGMFTDHDQFSAEVQKILGDKKKQAAITKHLIEQLKRIFLTDDQRRLARTVTAWMREGLKPHKTFIERFKLEIGYESTTSSRSKKKVFDDLLSRSRIHGDKGHTKCSAAVKAECWKMLEKEWPKIEKRGKARRPKQTTCGIRIAMSKQQDLVGFDIAITDATANESDR